MSCDWKLPKVVKKSLHGDAVDESAWDIAGFSDTYATLASKIACVESKRMDFRCCVQGIEVYIARGLLFLSRQDSISRLALG